MAKVSKGHLRQFSAYRVIVYQQVQKIERVRVRYEPAVFGIAPCPLKVQEEFLESRVQQKGLTFIV